MRSYHIKTETISEAKAGAASLNAKIEKCVANLEGFEQAETDSDDNDYKTVGQEWTRAVNARRYIVHSEASLDKSDNSSEQYITLERSDSPN